MSGSREVGYTTRDTGCNRDVSKEHPCFQVPFDGSDRQVCTGHESKSPIDHQDFGMLQACLLPNMVVVPVHGGPRHRPAQQLRCSPLHNDIHHKRYRYLPLGRSAERLNERRTWGP
ncbi:hypothetical protein SAMN05216184_101319 [Georgenia satyanarayanai]|uniref:Uncharacterized protein n=1 Tax=Georgenia satyanarayanai TaxID=860221 RepID=A0A2Y9A3A1_9MICO|nr:hypothetical protein A8987_101319 [Georgenia satyanarayanai]SSA36657.1 hypothetical protein SAMN05216184_101319 [Georgenia satyanarayanai]